MAQRRRRSLLAKGGAGATGGADDAPPSDADRADELRSEDASTEVVTAAEPAATEPPPSAPPVRPTETWPVRRRSTGGEVRSYADLDPAIRGEPPPPPPPEAPVAAPSRPRLSLFEAARARLAAESMSGETSAAPPTSPVPLKTITPPMDDPPTPASATPEISGSGASWLLGLGPPPGEPEADEPLTPPSPPAQNLVDRARRRPTGPTPASGPSAQVVENAKAGKLYTEVGTRVDDTGDPSWRDDTAPPLAADPVRTWATVKRSPTPTNVAMPPPPGIFDTPAGAPPAVRPPTNPSLLPEPRLAPGEPLRAAPLVVTPSGTQPAKPVDDDDEAEPPSEELLQNPVVLAAVAIAGVVLLVTFVVVLIVGFSTPEPEVKPVPPPTPLVPPPPVVVPGDPNAIPVAPAAIPAPPPPAAAAAPVPAPPAAKAAPKPLVKLPTKPIKKETAAKTGRLKLRSNQRVLVKVNGRATDFTPFELDLAPGTYRVTAAVPGRPDSEQTQSVTIAAGDTLPVSFSF